MKKCIITGGNSGIGKQAAIQIAQKGYRVIIGCRNEERGKQALEEIKKLTDTNDVEFVIIDMASKNSIVKAVDEIKARHEVLDVLIHNAADFDISRKKPVLSPDGIETIWATNHLGPVILTASLLPLLQKSVQGRVLTIASKGLVMYPNLKVDLDDPEFKHRKFSVAKAYYQSKLAQIMFTYRLAEKQKENNITANCIRVTNVKIDINRYPNVSAFMKWVYKLKSKSSISAEEMAKTYTWLAIAPELCNVSGKYYNEKNKVVSSSKYSLDEKNIDDVMKLTHVYLDKLNC
ncbi:MAG: SDR family NAD(P)-dependent oxidoreductase [Prolixibacteraceae bacterium]|nr:SDR family NAD(P)-dependent oxidoreductase [Prolixibacteraceae bacterium]